MPGLRNVYSQKKRCKNLRNFNTQFCNDECIKSEKKKCNVRIKNLNVKTCFAKENEM